MEICPTWSFLRAAWASTGQIWKFVPRGHFLEERGLPQDKYGNLPYVDSMAFDISMEPPPGFRGLDQNLPIELYERNLPHWRQQGATYFVTFRLADSLPQDKLEELRIIRERGLAACIGDYSKEGETLARSIFVKTEHWLDQGMGSCVLKDKAVRIQLVESLMHFDPERYQLSAYVIMPNHVHLLICPSAKFDLATIMQSCKRYAATKINKYLGRQGNLWQIESFDRIVRDSRHLWRCLQYIGNNPKKARLRKNKYSRWVRPDWQALGWSFVED